MKLALTVMLVSPIAAGFTGVLIATPNPEGWQFGCTSSAD